jgi:hypothetical protein
MTHEDAAKDAVRQDALRREIIRRNTKRRFEMASHGVGRRGPRVVR